jgi:hypothetical protein
MRVCPFSPTFQGNIIAGAGGGVKGFLGIEETEYRRQNTEDGQRATNNEYRTPNVEH